MICPRCNEEALNKIVFKKSEKEALPCDFCGTVWFLDEEINEYSGRPIESVSGGDDYTFLSSSEKEQDQMPVTKVTYK